MLRHVGRQVHVYQWYVCCTPRCNVVGLIDNAVTFDEGSQGQMAMVIYEWKVSQAYRDLSNSVLMILTMKDMSYLGKVTSTSDDTLPVSRSPRRAQLELKQCIAENVCVHVRRRQGRFLQSARIRPLHSRSP